METKSFWSALFTIITDAATWLVLATAAGLFLLVRGLGERSAVAYVVLGGVLFALVAGAGAIFVLVIQAIGERRAERNARIEQERFAANAKENLAIMAGMQRVQNQQNSLLLRQAREAQRQLPAPDDFIDVDALVADDSIFEELE